MLWFCCSYNFQTEGLQRTALLCLSTANLCLQYPTTHHSPVKQSTGLFFNGSCPLRGSNPLTYKNNHSKCCGNFHGGEGGIFLSANYCVYH